MDMDYGNIVKSLMKEEYFQNEHHNNRLDRGL